MASYLAYLSHESIKNDSNMTSGKSRFMPQKYTFCTTSGHPPAQNLPPAAMARRINGFAKDGKTPCKRRPFAL
jgi:hypothetical protein